MAAYVVLFREGPVKDPGEMEIYQRKAAGNDISEFNMTPLVGYGAMETLEGEAPDGVVILQFPTMDDAKRWYYSPGYQAAVPHRHKAADYRAVIVEGF